jgi:hypothetical protein
MAQPGKDKKKRVRRLVDVEVSHVSLVDRPANMTPFKFIKRDGTETEKGEFPMHISLKNMFGSRAPEVTSVIADTRPKAEAVAKMLLDAEKAEVTEQDGLFVVRKSGAPASADEQIVHLGKGAGVAYTVANLQKELSLYDVSGTSFEETMKAEGFVPGLMVGMDVLHQTIFNIAMDEGTNTPEAFANAVATAVDDFKKYVGDLIGALPEKAFKFEKALAAVTPSGTTPLHFTPEGFSAEVHDAVFGGEAPNPSAIMTEDGEDKAAEAPKADAAGDTPPAAGTAPDAASPAPSEGDDDKAKAEAAGDTPPKPDNLEELPAGTPETKGVSSEEVAAAVIDAVTKSVGAQIAEALKPLDERLAAQEASVGKLTKAVGGSVASTPDEDADNVIAISKGTTGGNTGGGEPPLMDTAYTKRG